MPKTVNKNVTALPAFACRPGAWIYYLGLAFAIALLVFAPAVGGSFVFDDFHLPFADPRAAEMPARFWIGGVRPVLMATYWLNFVISGARPLSYHFVNLILHAGSAVLTFFICDRLLAIARVPNAARLRHGFALFGAGLFLLHPLQTESVDYIAGRSELLSGFFVFAAWLIFLRNFDRDANFSVTAKIVVLGGLGLLAKESAIGLPALLLLTDFYFADRPVRRQIMHRARLYSVFLSAAAIGAIFILRSLTKGSAAGFREGISPFEYALTQCRVILIYLRLFIIPAGQNADWSLPFYHSLADPGAMFCVIFLCALLGLTVWLYKREPLISFGLAAFLVLLAPTSSIVPIADALAERRMYVPIAGLIIALLGLAAKLRIGAGWRWATAAAAILTCAVLSYNRSQVWVSDLTLWGDSVRANPANYRAHFGLGSALLANGDCAKAAREFAIALPQAKSGHEEILWNLAVAYHCDKRPVEALDAFHSYVKVNPTAAAWNQIGVVEATLEHADAALAAFEEALKLDPRNSMAYAYRGLARATLKDPQEARADLRRALELDPQNELAARGIRALPAER